MFSVTEQGCVEKTKRVEKFLGLGRNHHSGHDPTNFMMQAFFYRLLARSQGISLTKNVSDCTTSK